ncbi:MAG: hypothetical protein M3273_00010 [Actinomycetota bacterium]|nr:hypothetical protein [Actinomycetota bacterium]
MSNHTFVMVEDPNVALVSFRSELEERLRKLGEKYGIDSSASVTDLLRKLETREILKAPTVDGIAELVSLSNKAAHGAIVSPETLIPLRHQGSALLAGLDALVNK